MRFINNYVWYGRKASSYATAFLFGVIAERSWPDYSIWIILLIMIFFGWSRKTKSADDIWFKGNIGKIED